MDLIAACKDLDERKKKSHDGTYECTYSPGLLEKPDMIFNREMLALEKLFQRCKEDLINITRLLCATGSKKYELAKREDL